VNLHHRIIATSAILALACTAMGRRDLRAQDASQPKPVAVTVDLGLVNAAGNTRVTTLNGAENVKFKPAGSHWQFEEQVNTVYGRNQDSVTAEQVKVMGRADYTILAIVHVFAGGTYERNRFAGVGRRFEEIAGVALRPIDRPRDLLNVEIGSAVTQQRSTVAVTDNFVAMRVAASYKHKFTETVYAQQSVETLPNVDDLNDTRVNSETVLVAPLSSKMALRLSYVVRFDNVPEPGFQKTDRIFSSGLQVSF
jgi:putative salt-induced outer membrane protein